MITGKNEKYETKSINRLKKQKPCKRGNIASRGKWGECLCLDCLNVRKQTGRLQQATEENKKYKAEWRRQNKDKCCAYTTKWNSLNKSQRRLIEKFWRDKNPDKVASYNKASGRKWAQNNKGKRNAIKMKRLASLKSRTPSWADLVKIREIYEKATIISKSTGVPHEVDHIIPLQGKIVSGLHVHGNLQIITRRKNRAKKNKVELCQIN